MNNIAAGRTLKEKMSGVTSKMGTLLILIGIIILLSILAPNFLSVNNFMNIILQVATTGIIAYGMVMVMITGGIDLSAGSMLAFSCMVIAVFAEKGSTATAVVLGIAVATACGLINGFVISATGIPPFIMTLGMQLILRGAANLVTGGFTVTGFDNAFKEIGQGTIGGVIPIPVVIYVVLGIIMFLVLSKTVFGRKVFAIGGNEEASRLCGVNAKRVKLAVYTISAFLTGISAVLITSRTAAGNPSVGLNYEFDAIIAAVVGGTSLSGGVGSIPGCIIGALIVGCIEAGLTMLGVSAYYKNILKGVLIIAAVIIDVSKNKLAAKKA